jgi:hypothetical protein
MFAGKLFGKLLIAYSKSFLLRGLRLESKQKNRIFLAFQRFSTDEDLCRNIFAII